MVHALIPVKTLESAKSRLVPMLSLHERQHLVLAMLHDVLTTLQAVPQLASVSVITPDARVATVAQLNGATVCRESVPDLNGALVHAATELSRSGAKTVLLLFADLPFLTVADVEALLAQHNHGDIVLGASNDGGTNAMILPLPLPMPLLFGPHSLQRHQHAAKERGLRVATVRTAGLEQDVDHPADVARLADLGSTTAAGQFARTLVAGVHS